MSKDKAVTEVVNRAARVGIPLGEFIGTVKKTYVTGGVTGFQFIPKNYEKYLQALDVAVKLKKMGNDHDVGYIGEVMGSDAKKHGYLISARELSLNSSLHLELSKLKCDAHIDSSGICSFPETGHPLWGGRYDPVKLIPHGIHDLLPSMIGDNVYANTLINPILKRLDLSARVLGQDLILNGKYTPNPLSTGDKDSNIVASLIFKFRSL